MILLSLNIRGVGGTLKSASLQRLLRRTSPDIIFLQETMVEGSKARAFMNYFRPTWLSCVVSSVGTLGGLLVTVGSYKV
jgi:exonuclease III